MKPKKRLTRILLPLIFLLLIAALTVFGITEYRYYTHSRDNQYSLEVSIDSVESAPSQDHPVSFTVSNNSYIPVQVKEVLLLSVYDQAGNPVFLDGSPYTDSSVELRTEGKALTKALEKHQAVYISEYALEAGKPLFEARSEWDASADSVSHSSYHLEQAYTSYAVRLDVLLYGKPQAYPYADWSLLTTCSNILESADSTKVTLPVFTASQTYHWELDSGKALLVDIGNVQETDLVIPAKVWLTETPEGYVEDPVTGTCYDVKVKGNAFYENKMVQTVTFRDGVSIACNTMWDGRKQGMFEGCTSLTAVSNIPDGVISMEDAFRRCSSLTSMPQMPASVEDLSGCFLDCAALQEISPIPAGVTTMTDCFQGCVSIKEAPAFPEGITDLSGCFSGCTALETVAPLPRSVTVLDRTFTNCSSLTVTPVLPDGLKSMAATFYNCTNLTEVSNLPDTVVNLSSCFKQCSNLETVPNLPAQAFILNECFLGCTKLSGSVTLPGEAFAYSDYFVNGAGKIFDGCVMLESIQVDGCPEIIDAEEISADIPVHFTKTHTRKNCDSCHIFSDDFNVNGLSVVMDEVPEILVPMFMDILDDVPESLIATCDRLVFTSNWNHTEWAAGVYYWDSRIAYIRIRSIYPDEKISNISIWEDIYGGMQEAVRVKEITYRDVIFHELAHGYDRYSTSSTLSDTSRWRELHAKEGFLFNPPSELYAPYEFSRECFARAVAAYFCNSNYQAPAPGMYAYIDELFGDAA